MSTKAYNCPACGAPLAFNAQSGKMECASCGNAFDTEAMEVLSTAENREKISFENAAQNFEENESGVQAYACKNCGAELMTEDTTTAACCPYCGSPTVLPDRLAGGVKPEWIVPFKITCAQAQQQFSTTTSRASACCPTCSSRGATAFPRCASCMCRTGYSAAARKRIYSTTQKRFTQNGAETGKSPARSTTCAPLRPYAV